MSVTFTIDDAYIRHNFMKSAEELVRNFNKRKSRRGLAPVTATDLTFEMEVKITCPGAYVMAEIEDYLRRVENDPLASVVATTARMTHAPFGNLVPSSVWCEVTGDQQELLVDTHRDEVIALVAERTKALAGRLAQLREEEARNALYRSEEKLRVLKDDIKHIDRLGRDGGRKLADAVAKIYQLPDDLRSPILQDLQEMVAAARAWNEAVEAARQELHGYGRGPARLSGPLIWGSIQR